MKSEGKSKKQKTTTDAAPSSTPDETVLFKPASSGDADLMKLLSGGIISDSKKQKNDENDRARNQGVGAEKQTGSD